MMAMMQHRSLPATRGEKRGEKRMVTRSVCGACVVRGGVRGAVFAVATRTLRCCAAPLRHRAPPLSSPSTISTAIAGLRPSGAAAVRVARRVPARAAAPGATQASGTAAAAAPMAPPYVVLITGSSKGIGRALAEEFLRAGDSVVVCARSGEGRERERAPCVC